MGHESKPSLKCYCLVILTCLKFNVYNWQKIVSGKSILYVGSPEMIFMTLKESYACIFLASLISLYLRMNRLISLLFLMSLAAAPCLCSVYLCLAHACFVFLILWLAFILDVSVYLII